MTSNPWPDSHVRSVLFIIDASHSCEEDLLKAWLSASRAASGFDGQAQQVVVPIARDPEDIPVATLRDALAQDLSPDALVVPVRVVWRSSIDVKGTTPRLLDLLRGNQRRPGRSRAARILKKDPNRALCLAAEPATLEQLLARMRALHENEDHPDDAAEFIAGQAALALDIAERRQRGTRYKVPRRVASSLKSSATFRSALRSLSTQTGKPVADLEVESSDIMKELVATPGAFWQDVLAAFSRKMSSLGYERDFVTDPERLDRFRTVVREHPSAILWTHKTHVDGFAMYSMLFENDFPTPHVLGGVNMAFAGLGYAARRAGAIFIRRSFQDDPLYKMVLRQYIGYLLLKRFPLSWAFEGTRSRVGKLMPPRYGILKYVIEAAHTTGARNLHILPVAINYDLIGDVGDYAAEQSGVKKQAESLRWFVGYLRGLRRPLGKIYIDFGEPVVLEQVPSAEDPLRVAKIAFQVGVEVNRVTPITLASLVTMILLGAAPRALTRGELRREMIRLLAWAHERGIRVTAALERGNDEQLNTLAEALVSNALLTRFDEGPDVVYAIAPRQHAVAGYYRNTTIHHFVNKAIAELALLQASTQSNDIEATFWQEAERLRDLFKFEFFYSPTEQFRDDVRAELQRYDGQWESTIDKGAEYALQLLTQFRPLVAHSTLLSFVEAYRVVANVLARLNDDESLAEKECVSKALAYGRQAYLQRRISSQASIGKLLFQNGYKLASNMGLTTGGGADIGERRNQLSQQFRTLAHRLDRIRALALPNEDQDPVTARTAEYES